MDFNFYKQFVTKLDPSISIIFSDSANSNKVGDICWMTDGVYSLEIRDLSVYNISGVRLSNDVIPILNKLKLGAEVLEAARSIPERLEARFAEQHKCVKLTGLKDHPLYDTAMAVKK